VVGRGILTPDSVIVGSKTFDHPHNMYLAVFFQGGILAAILFFGLIAWSLIELFADYGQRSAKLALGLLIMALTSYLLDGHELIDKVGETWFLFWLPVGISLGLAWNRRLQPG
jgi:O-antigen ligase